MIPPGSYLNNAVAPVERKRLILGDRSQHGIFIPAVQAFVKLHPCSNGTMGLEIKAPRDVAIIREELLPDQRQAT